MIIKGINSLDSIHFSETTIHRYCGYNDKECFDLIEDADMGFLNTMKCASSRAFKFGMTRYNTSCDQRDIPGSSPIMSPGTVRSVGNATCHLVACHNGTG
jgi:hypothetical protein